jgi:hypothetical protein
MFPDRLSRGMSRCLEPRDADREQVEYGRVLVAPVPRKPTVLSMTV